MNREDFPMLKDDLVYLDNSATTFKPKQVINKVMEYYNNYTSNIHRGDYDISIKVDTMYDNVRDKVKDFINASSNKEIVFTSGTTDSLNKIIFGFMKYYLKEDDEVLLTKSEHASNFIPWLALAKQIKCKIKFIDLDNHLVTIDNVKKAITSKTKVISLAWITNVLGDVRPIYEIGKVCKDNNILFVVDGAQSVPHIKTDVILNNIDFLAFSSHKMLGPSGVGVLYGKYDLLNKMKPLEYGGGMNESFNSLGEVELKELPTRLEAGTPPIEGVIGLGEAIDYINKIGIDNISKHEIELKKYFLEEVKDIDNLIIYNKDTESGIVTFNLDNIFSQDTAVYLNHYNICVRAGNHCAKALKEDLNVKNTCRISFYIYNNKEDVLKTVKALKESKDIFNVIL